jgi:multidrug resistance efflux pump
MSEISSHTLPETTTDTTQPGRWPSGPPLYRRPRLIGIAAMLVLALFIIGIRSWLFTRDHETTRSAVIQVSDAGVWIVALFTETQATRIKPGQLARIRLGGSREVVRGRVESIADASAVETTAYARVPVKIVVDEPPDPQRILRPGMRVVVRVVVR